MTVNRSGAFFVLFCFLLIALPQISLKPIESDLSTVDIVSSLSLLVYFFAGLYYGGARVGPASRALLVYLGYVIVSFLFHAALSHRPEYIENTAYLIRTIAIFSPVIAAPMFLIGPHDFNRGIKLSILFAVVANFAIILMYSRGGDAFGAHQTFAFDGQRLTKRLGGLPGETGAYSFAVLIVAELLIVHYFINGRSYLFRNAAAIVAVALVFLAFKYSVARVMIVHFAVFCAFIFLSNVTSAIKKVFTILGAILAVTLAQILSISQSTFEQIAVGFSRLSFSAGINGATSGRFFHWSNVVEYLANDPWALIFGVGNRMGTVVLGHATENLLLFVLLEVGLVGGVLLFICFFRMLGPVYRAHRAGNALATGYVAIWLGAVVHALLNDIFTYYQAFPGLLFATAVLSELLRRNEAESRPARFLQGANNRKGPARHLLG